MDQIKLMSQAEKLIRMWDERFNCESYVYGTEPNSFLMENIRELKVGKTLCLADGEGRNGVFLAKHGHNVTSVDFSTEGLAKAKRLANLEGVEIETVCADLETYDMGINCWDNIVSIFCHLPIHIRRNLHRKVPLALRPGGIFLLEAYTPDQIELATGGPKTVDLLMTLTALQGELPGLILEHGMELKREIVEGKLHTGTSAVVQVIAKNPPWQIDS